jgi:glycosyltransferase involved in cell wall biosynthesis
MRIGIDARELSGRPTGVGRYLAGLLAQWAVDEQARRHEFVLYSTEPLGVTLDARRFPTHIAGDAHGTWWEQISLPRLAARDHLDLFFSPGYTAPLLPRTPSVVAIHDLSFVAHPEWFTMREGMRRRWLTRKSAHRSRAVITISEFSKREIVERLHVDPAHVHVVPPGITKPAQSLNPGRPENVLYVGSIFNRRRIPDLVRAFAPIARKHPHARLDIVGDNRSFPRQDVARAIAADAPGGQVQWRQYVSDDELSALYRSARAFAFLSEYEGLGLTPLEALSVGVPPVVLATPVARESCGDAALYVQPGDVPGITRALEQLLFDERVRESLLAAAPQVLARYEWPKAARDTLAVLEAAAA